MGLDRYIYHISKHDNLLFVCLADSSVKLKTAFIFLDEIHKKFTDKYTQDDIAHAIAFSMNSSFSEIYKQQFVLPPPLRPSSTATKTPTRRKYSIRN